MKTTTTTQTDAPDLTQVTMPFGKYKHLPILKLQDFGYVFWAYFNCDFKDGNVILALKKRLDQLRKQRGYR